MPRQYNVIYKQLVKGDSDIVGNIAYSLYKADKVKFIEDFKEKHGGNEPMEDELRHFHEICCMDTNVSRYKMQALNILQGFLDDTLSETTAQMERDLERNYKKELVGVVGKTTAKSFFLNVLQSVVGAFLFMLLMCAIIFLLRFSDHQYTFTIGGSGNAELEEVEMASGDALHAIANQNINL